MVVAGRQVFHQTSWLSNLDDTEQLACWWYIPVSLSCLLLYFLCITMKFSLLLAGVFEINHKTCRLLIRCYIGATRIPLKQQNKTLPVAYFKIDLTQMVAKNVKIWRAWLQWTKSLILECWLFLGGGVQTDLGAAVKWAFWRCLAADASWDFLLVL